jgi:hypothetical protein
MKGAGAVQRPNSTVKFGGRKRSQVVAHEFTRSPSKYESYIFTFRALTGDAHNGYSCLHHARFPEYRDD